MSRKITPPRASGCGGFAYLLDLEAMGEKSFVPPACGNVSTCRRCWMASTSRNRNAEAVRLRQALVERFSL